MVLVAAGAGVLVRDAAAGARAGPALAVLVTALPVVLLPTLAWGVGGRVTAVEVPDDLQVGRHHLSGARPGTVGLLPWSQYRRYGWNGDRVSLTLVPRMVDQRVILDDGLPLASGRVPGEDPAARAVGERIAAGVPPVEALAAAGVRWVVVEKDTGLPDADLAGSLPPGAQVVHDGPSATVVALDRADRATDPGDLAGDPVGWSLTCLTWVAATVCLALEGCGGGVTGWYGPGHDSWCRLRRRRSPWARRSRCSRSSAACPP